MVISWIGLAVVLIGGGAGIVEYQSNQKENRVSNTLTVLERSYKPPVLKARQAVDIAWWNEGENIKAILLASGTEQEVSKRLDNAVMNLIGKYKIRKHIFTLIEFYEEISICINENICDKQVAFELFGEGATTFYNQNYLFIKRLRKKSNNNDIAGRLQSFRKEFRTWKNTE